MGVDFNLFSFFSLSLSCGTWKEDIHRKGADRYQNMNKECGKLFGQKIF